MKAKKELEKEVPLETLSYSPLRSVQRAIENAEYEANARVGYIPYVPSHPLVDPTDTYERATARHQSLAVQKYLKTLK